MDNVIVAWQNDGRLMYIGDIQNEWQMFLKCKGLQCMSDVKNLFVVTEVTLVLPVNMETDSLPNGLDKNTIYS